MFFGAPCIKTRAFDTIFRGIKSLNTLFHSYISFNLEFEGDVASPMALINVYLIGCWHKSARKLKKAVKEAKVYDGNLFNTAKVQEYIKALDLHFKQCLEGLFAEFQIYSNPIIYIPDMNAFNTHTHLSGSIEAKQPLERAVSSAYSSQCRV